LEIPPFVHPEIEYLVVCDRSRRTLCIDHVEERVEQTLRERRVLRAGKSRRAGCGTDRRSLHLVFKPRLDGNLRRGASRSQMLGHGIESLGEGLA